MLPITYSRGLRDLKAFIIISLIVGVITLLGVLRNFQPTFVKFKGHTDTVTSITFSKAGDILVSASSDGTLRSWNVETKQAKMIFKGHSNGVRSATISSDGSMLASGGLDHTVRLWDVKTGRVIKVLKSQSVYALAYSFNGKMIASGGAVVRGGRTKGGEVRIWSSITGNLIRVIALKESKSFYNTIISVAFCAGDTLIETEDLDGVVKIWDIKTGVLKSQFKTVTNDFSMPVSFDGKFIVGAEDAIVKFWSIDGTNLKTTLHNTQCAHECNVTNLAISSDNHRLASAAKSGEINIWNLQNFTLMKTITVEDADITSLAIAPSGKYLAVAQGDDIDLWSLN